MLVPGTGWKRIEDTADPETERGMNLSTGATRSRSRSVRRITYMRPCDDSMALTDSPTPYNPENLMTTGSYPWTCVSIMIVRDYNRPGGYYTEIWEKKNAWGPWE